MGGCVSPEKDPIDDISDRAGDPPNEEYAKGLWLRGVKLETVVLYLKDSEDLEVVDLSRYIGLDLTGAVRTDGADDMDLSEQLELEPVDLNRSNNLGSVDTDRMGKSLKLYSE